MLWLTHLQSHSCTLPPFIYSNILTPRKSFLKTPQLSFRGDCSSVLGDDFNDIAYDYTYLDDMKIGT